MQDTIDDSIPEEHVLVNTDPQIERDEQIPENDPPVHEISQDG